MSRVVRAVFMSKSLSSFLPLSRRVATGWIDSRWGWSASIEHLRIRHRCLSREGLMRHDHLRRHWHICPIGHRDWRSVTTKHLLLWWRESTVCSWQTFTKGYRGLVADSHSHRVCCEGMSGHHHWLSPLRRTMGELLGLARSAGC